MNEVQSSTEPTWFLATVTVAFRGNVSGSRELSEAELDELADSLMEIENMATVRVESGGRPTVYRVDVRADEADAVPRVAVEAIPYVERRTGLHGDLQSVAVRAHDDEVIPTLD